MSFRQKNEVKHQWDLFCRTNRELILDTGIPYEVLDDFWRFLYFVEHDYDYATRFSLRELTSPQLGAYKELLARFSDAGFGGSYKNHWVFSHMSEQDEK